MKERERSNQRNRDRALQFSDEPSFTRALELLDDLSARGPIWYGLADEHTVVMPPWVFKKLLPLLGKHGVESEELEVVSISELSPEEQARLRGLNWGDKKVFRG